MAMKVNYDAVLATAGFVFSTTCQCGGSLGRIFIKDRYEIKVWPYRQPPQFALNYKGDRGQTRGLTAGTIEGLQTAITQHVK
jgi:hypothetical protein